MVSMEVPSANNPDYHRRRFVPPSAPTTMLGSPGGFFQAASYPTGLGQRRQLILGAIRSPACDKLGEYGIVNVYCHRGRCSENASGAFPSGKSHIERPDERGCERGGDQFAIGHDQISICRTTMCPALPEI